MNKCKFCKMEDAVFFSHFPEDCKEPGCEHEPTCKTCAEYCLVLMDELELSRN